MTANPLALTDAVFSSTPTRADVARHLGKRGLEALDWYSRFDLWRDRYFDKDGSSWMPITAGNPVGSRSSRRDGRNAYTHWTEQQLLISRDAARILDAEDPIAQGILSNLVNFTVGKGPSISFTAKKGKTVDDKYIELLNDRYKAFCDRLKDETGGTLLFDEYCRESVRTAIIDGEQATRIVPTQNGATIRRVEPEQITQPPKGSIIDGWHMGVLSDKHDITKRYGYWVASSPGEVGNGDFVKCKDLVLIKRNTPSTVVRGVSDFFSVTDDLEDTGRLIDGIRVGARVRAKIAYIEKLNGAPPSAASDFAAGQATDVFTDPLTLLGNAARSQSQTYTRRLPPGAVLTSTDNVDITTLPQGQSLEAIAAAQFCMRVIICVRWCLPEFLATADASNNNYASILVAGGPAVRMFEAQQSEFAERFKQIIWRILEIDNALGYLPNGLLNMVDLSVEMPSPVIADPLQEAQLLEIEHRNGVTSKTTWRNLRNRDDEVETANFRQERAEDPTANVQLPDLASLMNGGDNGNEPPRQPS